MTAALAVQFAAVCAACVLALVGLVIRDARTALTAVGLTAAGAVGVPLGGVLVGAGAAPERRRGWALPAAALAGVALLVVLGASGHLPVLDGTTPGVVLRAAGMAGFAYAAVRMLTLWRATRRVLDAVPFVGVVLLACTQALVGPMWWERGASLPAALMVATGIILVGLPQAVGVPLSGLRGAGADAPMAARLRGVLGAAERGDVRAGEHSRRVAELCGAVADRMGLSPVVRDQVAAAGRLHHIGAVRTGERCQSLSGDAVLEALGGVPLMVREAVRGQFERMDGTGFPDGRAGRDLRLPTRILAVCDAYDECLMAGAEPSEALRELRSRVGADLCPACLEGLEAVLESGLHQVLSPPRAATATTLPPALAQPAVATRHPGSRTRASDR